MSANPHVGAGHAVPIFINKTRYEVTVDRLTGKEIKALGGYGDDFDLFLLNGEGDHKGVPVPDTQLVDIKGGMHFRALPGGRNFGDAVHPDLLVQVDRLRDMGFVVDVVVDGGMVGIVFPAFRLPAGVFNAETTRLLVRMSTDPNAAIDMFWTASDLLLKSGEVPRSAENLESHLGTTWRRFSWHWNRPWIPGRDNLVSYVEFVEDRLTRGV